MIVARLQAGGDRLSVRSKDAVDALPGTAPAGASTFSGAPCRRTASRLAHRGSPPAAPRRSMASWGRAVAGSEARPAAPGWRRPSSGRCPTPGTPDQAIGALRGGREGLAHALGFRRAGEGRPPRRWYRFRKQFAAHGVLAELGPQALDLLVALVCGPAVHGRLAAPGRNCSGQRARAAPVTPLSRATVSSDSPRSRRRIASVFRRAKNRPGLAGALAPGRGGCRE
jgi:hypothetical protein